VRVLVADDHELFRDGVKRILGDHPDVKKVGQAGSAHEVFELIQKEQWDVVILDIKLPGRSGLDVLKELKEYNPKLPVLVVSMYPVEQFAVRVLKAGASGYLNKTSAALELITALRQIVKGEKYISPAVASALAEAIMHRSERAPHESLSDREYEIFRLISAGKTVGQIAKELSISVKTVSTHRGHILEKMNLKNNAEIVQYALAQGLIE
jgi:two-component system, NarL family, invasion response regulator UvrY